MVCDKVVCERWYVTKMVCDRWCVKDGVSESLAKMVCDRREAGGGREATRDTESKTRTPHSCGMTYTKKRLSKGMVQSPI